MRARQSVEDGLLRTGLHFNAFRDTWGDPYRTSVTTGDRIAEAGWGPFFGSATARTATYDVWDYLEPKVRLLFYKNHLVGWQTELSVDELRAASRR